MNGDFVDRGTTRRRHIQASAIRCIGKEANEIDRQQMLGANGELDPEYGLCADSILALQLGAAELVRLVGKRAAAKALRIPPGRLALILSDELAFIAAASVIATRVPSTLADARNQRNMREAELQRAREIVQALGLRGAARNLGLDPSNLRRWLG